MEIRQLLESRGLTMKDILTPAKIHLLTAYVLSLSGK